MFVKRAVPAALALLVVAPIEVTATTNDSISAVLSTTPQLSGLASLVGEVSDFLEDLQEISDITVFAPSNAALAAAKNSYPSFSSSASDRDFLAALLRYHVLYDTVRAADISTTPKFAHTLLNDTSYSNVTGGQVVELERRGSDLTLTSGLRATANIIASDIPLPNGVLHIIDAVLTIPPALPSTAVAANLTSFAGALAGSHLATDVAPMKDLTIFAPNNPAFAAISGAASHFSAAQLHAVLAYHIIPDSQGYSPLLTNTTDVSTLAGADARVDILTTQAGAIFINAARVVLADVLVAQGVLHIIDAVLDVNASSHVAPDPAATTASVLFTEAGATATGQALWFTSGAATPATPNPAFSTTTDRVVAGYSTAPTQNPALATDASTSSSHAGAARIAAATGGVERAGLYGGMGAMAAAAAFLAA